MTVLVALDLETTGLDPKRDKIIEIGAVRFKKRRVEAKWSTMVNPGIPIPKHITQLTGIAESMVTSAPTLAKAARDLEKFVGDAPVIGHNVGVDLKFLRNHHLLLKNKAIDTYDFAAILLPSAQRYNLGALGRSLGIPLPNSHRALDDAYLTYAVFVRLYEKALSLPLALIEEIAQLGNSVEWGVSWIFQQLWEECKRAGQEQTLRTPSLKFPQFDLNDRMSPLLSNVSRQARSTQIEEPDLPQLEALKTKVFDPPYQSSQLAMAQSVAAAFAQKQHLLIEAPPGMDRQIAYLLPAFLWALQEQKRVVIATKNEQELEQIVNQDLPRLSAAIGKDAQGVLLKSPHNYICPQRFETLRDQPLESPESLRVLAKVLVWLQNTQTGYRQELNLLGQREEAAWHRIAADDQLCTDATCLKPTSNSCPFFHAQHQITNSHLLLVSHERLAMDLISDNPTLPTYEYLIIDDAHNLEDAITEALKCRCTFDKIDYLIGEIGNAKVGILAWLLRSLQAHNPGIVPRIELNEHMQTLITASFQAQETMRTFFVQAEAFLQSQQSTTEQHWQRSIISSAIRHNTAWKATSLIWEHANHTITAFLSHLAEFHQSLAESPIHEETKAALAELAAACSRLNREIAMLNEFVTAPTAKSIYWIDKLPNQGNPTLYIAPLHVGQLLEQSLWHSKTSVILTSTTLSINGSFDYLRSRLSTGTIKETVLPSPLDFSQQVLFCIVKDIPEPKKYLSNQRAIEQGLIAACKEIHGRVLVLFTTYTQLQETAQVISPVLNQLGIQVYQPGHDGLHHEVITDFGNSKRAVLFECHTTWESVSALVKEVSMLIVVKLPFDVFPDPIKNSRMKTFKDPFQEYSLIEGLLRFRQGINSMFTSQIGQRVIIIFDSRIVTKSYGHSFLEAVPECYVHISNTEELPRIVAKWRQTV